MRRKRRNHAPSFKAKVALAAARGDKTIAEVAEQFDLHPNQVQQWRKQLVANAIELFGEGAGHKQNSESEIKSLHAKIGQLTMERDFLSKALDR